MEMRETTSEIRQQQNLNDFRTSLLEREYLECSQVKGTLAICFNQDPKISLVSSLYCLPYNFYDVRFENLVLDQLIIDMYLYSHHLSA